MYINRTESIENEGEENRGRQREIRERKRKRQGAREESKEAGMDVGRFYTDNVQSLCMRLTGATAS